MENQKSVFLLFFYLLFCGVFYVFLSAIDFQNAFLHYLESQYRIDLSLDAPQIFFALKEFKKYVFLLISIGILFFIFNRIKDFQKQNLFFWLIFLFVFRFILQFYFCHYPRIFTIYRDELLYFQLAQNLAEGRGFLVHNLPSSFQKILYSLFLMPYFLTKNQVVLDVVQSFLVTSCIFPIYLIAKKILTLKKTIIFVLVFSIFLPDLHYAQTFMSETLFLPLSLWCFYIFLIILENDCFSKKNAFLAFLFGVVYYFAYLCKEIAILFLPAFFILPILKKDKILFLNLLFFLFGFLLFFILFKITIFKEFGNSYNQSDAFVLILEGRPSYLIYSAIYYLISIIIGFGFFGVIFIFLYFKNLHKNAQNLCLFLCFLILSTVVAVAYFIFIREDFDFFSMDNPRALLRYVLYAWILFFILCMSIFEKKELESPLKIKILFLIIPLFYILFFYKGVADFSHIEQNVLNYLLPIFGSESTENQVLIFKIILCVLSCFFVYFVFFKKQAHCVLKCFLVAFFVLQVLNNAYAALMLPFKYGVRQDEIEQTQKIARFITENPSKTFLILGEAPTRPLALADNFLNFKNVATVRIHTLLQLNQWVKNGQVCDIPIAVLSRSLTQDWTQFPPQSYHLQRIDFVLLPNMFPAQLPPEWALKQFSGAIFTLYKNTNPQILPPVAVQNP